MKKIVLATFLMLTVTNALMIAMEQVQEQIFDEQKETEDKVKNYLNKQNKFGYTALHCCCIIPAGDSLDFSKMDKVTTRKANILLQNGITLDIKDNDGNTALDLAEKVKDKLPLLHKTLLDFKNGSILLDPAQKVDEIGILVNKVLIANLFVDSDDNNNLSKIEEIVEDEIPTLHKKFPILRQIADGFRVMDSEQGQNKLNELLDVCSNISNADASTELDKEIAAATILLDKTGCKVAATNKDGITPLEKVEKIKETLPTLYKIMNAQKTIQAVTGPNGFIEKTKEAQQKGTPLKFVEHMDEIIAVSNAENTISEFFNEAKMSQK